MAKPTKEGSRAGRPYEPAEPAPPEDRTPQDKGKDTVEGQQATAGAEQPQQNSGRDRAASRRRTPRTAKTEVGTGRRARWGSRKQGPGRRAPREHLAITNGRHRTGRAGEEPGDTDGSAEGTPGKEREEQTTGKQTGGAEQGRRRPAGKRKDKEV